MGGRRGQRYRVEKNNAFPKTEVLPRFEFLWRLNDRFNTPCFTFRRKTLDSIEKLLRKFAKNKIRFREFTPNIIANI